MVRRLRFWWGVVMRLRLGYCPMCNSSPPRFGCLVCAGDVRYGRDASPGKRDVWRMRWATECGMPRRSRLYAD